MSRKVLILGATGRFGRACTRAFEATGDQVIPFDRTQGALMQAAVGVDVIVVGWNPAYPDWMKQVQNLHAQVIAAAKASGALVVVPGNVYVFGPLTSPPWSEHSPHRAENPLGRIRIEMEEAYRASGVRTILLRAGDFLDTQPSGNWFDAVITAKLSKGLFVYPGDPDIPHAWAYLPDMARAVVSLVERADRLPLFADIPFPGYTLTGRDLHTAINSCLAKPVALETMSWWPLQLARPFWPMGRCLLEMRYLWNTGHSLEGALLQTLLPDFKETPLSQALQQALPEPLLK